MKYAVIDIGTNSMRLLLADFEEGQFVCRKKVINTTRMGTGIDERGRISEESIERNVIALAEFKNLAIEYGCSSIRCIGTAALRNASNRDEFVKIALENTGVNVEIISGEEEALLGYKGVMGGVNLDDRYVLIIDIGGGSTEFIVGNSEEIILRESVGLGALRLTEKFIKNVPESKANLESMVQYIEENISNIIKRIKSLETPLLLIGIGGTITSVSAIQQELETYSMEKIHFSKVSYSELKTQIDRISEMNIEEIRELKGLQTKRAEIILAGELILKSIMKSMDFQEIVVSEFDNLEGYILKNEF